MVVFLAMFLMIQTTDSLEQLKKSVLEVAESAPGTYAVAFVDLQDEKNRLYINADELFHAASTMKTPVLIEAYKQASEGKIKISDSLLVRNEFKSIVDGSTFSLDISRDGGEGFYQQVGKKVPIREILYDMITVSGNLATNVMIDLLDAKEITQTMRKLGAKDIQVLRGVEDMKAFEAGLSNRTTARDLAVILEHIGRGTAVSKESSEDMLMILKDQKYRDVIPALLPEGIIVANKTGSITRIVHDSGVVYLPDGRAYVLVFLSKDLDNNATGTRVGSEISRLVYEFMKNE